MSSPEKHPRHYTTIGRGPSTPPQYERVVRSLSDAEIRSELATERGRTDEGWRGALEREKAEREGRRK